MDVSAKLAALTTAIGPYGHVRPGRAAETPGFAFYGAIGILVCDCIPGSCRTIPKLELELLNSACPGPRVLGSHLDLGSWIFD